MLLRKKKLLIIISIAIPVAKYAWLTGLKFARAKFRRLKMRPQRNKH